MIVSNEEAAVFCGDAALAGDEAFQLIVAGVDATVKDYLGRQLEFGRRTDMPELGYVRSRSVRLREWPIAALVDVRIDPYNLTFADSTLFDPAQFLVVDPDDNEVTFLNGWFPTIAHSLRITYDAGYYPIGDSDVTHTPRMPANARLGTFKQIKLEWESGGAVRTAETLLDHSETFAVSQVTGSIILDEAVKSYLRTLKRY